ncbi:hypothetical protein [uncultured Modestobacter sp.]|uniref:hypothetical protein n=1 Tax=uncultured Modestobacter sp. TaxID=380048 RepID=UPI002601F655|nr:hypothetical protein [uncultured Modestobacter sp.]
MLSGRVAPRDRSAAVAAAERLAAVSTLIAGLEHVAAERDHGPGGLLDWSVVRESTGLRSPLARRIADAAAGPQVARCLALTQVAASLALLAPTGPRARLVADATVTSTMALLRARLKPGADGADQTAFCVHALNTVARAGEGDPAVVDAVLWASALQSVGSYAVSGWLKVGSPSWRSGRALPELLRTRSYGEPRAYDLVRRHPTAARVLTHGVVALESAMPLVFARRGRWAPALLGGAAALHAGNAVAIGLNRFPWAFGATYPAVLYAATPHAGRSDALPRVVAAATVAAGGILQFAHLRRRAAVRRGMAGGRVVRLASGRRVVHRLDGPAHGPVVVLEGGPMLTDAQWTTVRNALGPGIATLSHQRCGHGGSDEVPATGPAVAADLVELLDAVVPGRDVLLVGHHLSAGPVLDAAAELGGRVQAIVLLDPVWPGSSAQAHQSIAAVVRWLRLGLGRLLERPDWAQDLPRAARAAALAEYRDPRLWTAADRERSALRGSSPPTRVEQPLLLVASGQDPFTHPVLRGTARALRRAAPGLRVAVVPEVEGADRLVTAPGAGARVAALIESLVTGSAARQEDRRAAG